MCDTSFVVVTSDRKYVITGRLVSDILCKLIFFEFTELVLHGRSIIKTKWNQIISWPAIISSFLRGETWAVGLRQSWDLYTKYGMFETRDLIVQITCMWPQSWNIYPISRFMYTSRSRSEVAKQNSLDIFFRKSRFLVRLLSLVNIIWLQRDSVKP